MQVTLDAFALKHLQRALTCLTKYGDELAIYASPDSLSLSATNSSLSAYCRFTYSKDVFTRYKVNKNQGSQDGSGDVPTAQGKLLTKVRSPSYAGIPEGPSFLFSFSHYSQSLNTTALQRRWSTNAKSP